MLLLQFRRAIRAEVGRITATTIEVSNVISRLGSSERDRGFTHCRRNLSSGTRTAQLQFPIRCAYTEIPTLPRISVTPNSNLS
jgi:hypothetical protein